MIKTISQNTTYLTIASVLQKLLAFAYFTYLANTIGVEGTGQYFFALSFTTIFVVFIDLGFTNVFIREASRAKEKLSSYLSTVLVFKVGMAVITYIAAVATIHLLGYDVEIRHLVYLSGVTMIFDTFHLSFYGALRAIGDLKYEGIGVVASQFLTLILGSVFLYMGLPLIYLIAAFTIPSGLNVLFAWYMLRKRYQVAPTWKFDAAVFKQLGMIAIPFTLAAIFARLYSYVDTVLLSKMLGDTAVGLYSIPYKITFAFQFIPLALVAALYPKFSEYFVRDKDRLAVILERGLIYLLLIATPIAAGIAVLADPIITMLYSDSYLPSIVPLQILVLSLVFSYTSFPIGAFLNACDKQVAQTKIVGVVLLINIILNVTLIPILGVSGAAVAAFAGNACLTIFGYFVVIRVVTIDHKYMIRHAIGILASGAGMAGVVWLLRTQMILIPIVAGTITYPALLFLSRTVTPSQLKEAKRLVRGGSNV